MVDDHDHDHNHDHDHDDDDDSVIVEAWVPAQHLQPVDLASP